MSEKLEFQTWICPKCFDDHSIFSDCTPVEIGVFMPSDADKSFIAEKYREQNAKIKELEAKLSIAVEALQRYANGQALKVKPEKIHLYIDDICHGNPLWHQRSMSDYDAKLLAKEALEKLRG